MVSINGQTLNINETCFYAIVFHIFPGSQTFGFRDEGLFWDEVTDVARLRRIKENE